MRRRFGFIAMLALVVVFAGQAVYAQSPIVLKLGNIQAPTQSASLACERMAKLVFERSNGRLKIEFFPASQLGNAITQIEGVMMGTQDMFQTPPSGWRSSKRTTTSWPWHLRSATKTTSRPSSTAP